MIRANNIVKGSEKKADRKRTVRITSCMQVRVAYTTIYLLHRV